MTYTGPTFWGRGRSHEIHRPNLLGKGGGHMTYTGPTFWGRGRSHDIHRPNLLGKGEVT